MYSRLNDIPFSIHTSLVFSFPLEQLERSGWYSRKLFFPQTRPDGQSPESQSPSPIPHWKVLHNLLLYSEQCPSDKQYSQFEWSQSESTLQTRKEIMEVFQKYVPYMKLGNHNVVIKVRKMKKSQKAGREEAIIVSTFLFLQSHLLFDHFSWIQNDEIMRLQIA